MVDEEREKLVKARDEANAANRIAHANRNASAAAYADYIRTATRATRNINALEAYDAAQKEKAQLAARQQPTAADAAEGS